MGAADDDVASMVVTGDAVSSLSVGVSVSVSLFASEDPLATPQPVLATRAAGQATSSQSTLGRGISYSDSSEGREGACVYK